MKRLLLFLALIGLGVGAGAQTPSVLQIGDYASCGGASPCTFSTSSNTTSGSTIFLSLDNATQASAVTICGQAATLPNQEGTINASQPTQIWMVANTHTGSCTISITDVAGNYSEQVYAEFGSVSGTAQGASGCCGTNGASSGTAIAGPVTTSVNDVIFAVILGAYMLTGCTMPGVTLTQQTGVETSYYVFTGIATSAGSASLSCTVGAAWNMAFLDVKAGSGGGSTPPPMMALTGAGK